MHHYNELNKKGDIEMINAIRAKGKAQDLYTLAIGCQNGRVHQIIDGHPEKPLAYIVSAQMFEDMILLEAGLYGVTKSDLLHDTEQLGLKKPAVEGLARIKIYFVRDLLRQLHLDPQRLTDSCGIGEVVALEITAKLKALGARHEVFFPHGDVKLRKFWLGET